MLSVSPPRVCYVCVWDVISCYSVCVCVCVCRDWGSVCIREMGVELVHDIIDDDHYYEDDDDDSNGMSVI